MALEIREVDIKENSIKQLDSELLSILLKDRSSGKNIIWGTDIYADRGEAYNSQKTIKIDLITGRFGKVIRPRFNKSQKEQRHRIKYKAEVFTPSWICNKQNNIVDYEWFKKNNIFNMEKDTTWIVNKNKIEFPEGKTWQEYVLLKRMEISCGEAPYLVSRYDTVTGLWIDIGSRVGILDRKLRVINENTNNEAEWIEWVYKAYKSTYAFEWQGDSLLIARENMLLTFIDYYVDRFSDYPSNDCLLEIAKILSWNVFQMDGLKYVIPNSCKPITKRQLSLFENDIQIKPCQGCLKNNNEKHTGVYCKIKDWQTGKTMKFISLLKGMEKK